MNWSTNRNNGGRSETPSSILSSESDIRFTRKLGYQYRCGCCIAASFITFLLFATLSLFAAHKFLTVDPGSESVFSGILRIIEGDVFSPELADPNTEDFRVHAREYRESINLKLKRSKLRKCFISCDILAFDGMENINLAVYFNLKFNSKYMSVSSNDLYEIMTDDMSYLKNKTIDVNSLEIVEESVKESISSHTTAIVIQDLVTSTSTAVPKRNCEPMELPYCAALETNYTSYPNMIGHRNIDEVKADVIAFRELVDSECYRLSYDFVCHILQPPCNKELVKPCQNFCKDFWNGCGKRLPYRLQKILNCTSFPQYSAEGPTCISKPGCGDELESRGLGSRLCDGVVDCPDLSDETSCSHCPAGSLHCSSTKACVHPFSRCDGILDCPDGSDEQACLFLAPDVKSLSKLRSVQAKYYYSSGNVIFTERGLRGKVCVSNLNTSMPLSDTDSTLQTIGTSLCKTLNFRKASNVTVKKDEENDSRYVKMENPTAEEISFIPSHCATKDILNVHCELPECGLQTVRMKEGIDGLNKVASTGDWPWHVALYKARIHICDGTLIAMDWIISTASCFQGQGKAEWVVRGGSTRLNSMTPWQQERHIMGMLKSPVEGSTVVLLKLDREFVTSDFLRPACLPPQGSVLGVNLTYCNTLGWSQDRTMLQRVDLKLSEMEQCSNISITTVNSVCTDSYYSTEDCTEEELAGSPMICYHADNKRWILAGVSNWRIACSKVGDRRPRLYDNLISNLDWIKSTIGVDML